MPPLNLDDAQARVLARVRALETETVNVADAGGRVTADAVRAEVDLPAVRELGDGRLCGAGRRPAGDAAGGGADPGRSTCRPAVGGR